MEQRAEGRNLIVRYTMADRVVHWTIAGTFVYVMLTGLALFWPPFYWLADVFGGGPVIRYWHPIIALVFLAVLLLMLARWFKDMKVDAEDRRWIGHFREFVTGDERVVADAGRFNFGQKSLFWVQFATAVLLVLSGVTMWFPRSFDVGLRQAAFIVHDLSAIAAIGALIVHIYMGVFVTRGSVDAMTRGTVSARWAEAHHARWLKALRSATPQARQ
ncbi:MAG TPA: formate dehydrogenase subunit gamma [bacterium]|nr:formate dehydrogenase subunit gamma [bacterium]